MRLFNEFRFSPKVPQGTLLNLKITAAQLSMQSSGGSNGLVFSPVMNIFSDTSNEYKQFITFLTINN